ncbi:uncharacterized [Tachysurus ichikawai]
MEMFSQESHAWLGRRGWTRSDGKLMSLMVNVYNKECEKRLLTSQLIQGVDKRLLQGHCDKTYSRLLPQVRKLATPLTVNVTGLEEVKVTDEPGTLAG